MFYNLFTYQNNKLARCLLPIALLVSYFIFSNISESCTFQTQVFKTELVDAVQTGSGKAVSYKRACALVSKNLAGNLPVYNFKQSFILILNKFNQRVNHHFVFITRLRLQIIAYKKHINTKTIPISFKANLPDALRS